MHTASIGSRAIVKLLDAATEVHLLHGLLQFSFTFTMQHDVQGVDN